MATTRPSPITPSLERAGVSWARLWLSLIAGVSWIYLVYMAWGMANMDQAAAQWLMPAMMHWTAADLGLVFLMWAIMMVAMMLPSAYPMVQTFARTAAAQRDHSAASLIGAFVAGYLAVWAAFSALATLAQWGLLEVRLVTPMMESASGRLSGALLIVAGLYQFTPLKNACLKKCRTPLGFILSEWRPGTRGAFVMGLRHGAYCTGCCVTLMLLLFVLGVMNLLWILALTFIVVVEKLLPAEMLWPSRAIGSGLIVWGGYLLIALDA